MTITDTDRTFLTRAVDLAEQALTSGDEPFGSVLVSADGTVLFEDHNHVAGGDHTQHPEFAIARWAAQHLDPAERAASTVYTLLDVRASGQAAIIPLDPTWLTFRVLGG